MRSYELWIFFYTLLLSGGVYAELEQNDIDTKERGILLDNLPALEFDSYIGAIHNVIMTPHVMANKESCYIIKPNSDEIALTDDLNNLEIETIEGNDCGVKINVITEDMFGEWTLIGLYEMFGMELKRTLPFTITIEGINPTEKETEVKNDDNDETTWLTNIEHFTRTDENIDITLSKLSYEEECYIKPPNGDLVKVEEASIDGLTVQSKSEYVSCRVTLGPMNNTFLGNWTLCGKYYDEKYHQRCQTVSIAWNNNNNPDSIWHTTRQALFNHTVNLGGKLTPSVLGSGSILTCHVITPNGEDLVITSDSEYPGITRMADSLTSVCSVAIGPIEHSMLEAWTVYGKFRHIAIGLNEVRLPMNLLLYDEDNPYAPAYNITNLNPINRVINLGSRITMEIVGTGTIDECIYRSPKGNLYKQSGDVNFSGVSFVNVENGVTCQISMGPITEEMLGEWQITGKFSSGNVFSERRQIFNVTKEDPENPIIEEDRTIINMSEQILDANIGSTLTITTTLNSFVTRQSCHIRTPAGLQYKIMEGFNIPGVEVIEGTHIECGVNITVLSEDMVGEWTLISRVLSLNTPTERRLPFIINVEEIVYAFPEEITVVEGNSVYVRLRNSTTLYDTCLLNRPKDNDQVYEVDPFHKESCGFIINNVQQEDTGLWEISYGRKIIYRAFIEIDVIERLQLSKENLTFIKDRGVNLELGPEDTVYCKIEDPTRFVVFDGFGKCNIVIERVTMEHNGYWKMYVGLPGQVVVVEESFFVTVEKAEPKAVVTTNVVKERPSVVLTCSVLTPHQVRACKFRDAKGNIHIAAQAVGEGRYISQNSLVTYESNVHNHECGLRITDPTSEDLGLWRCAIETEQETLYGFLTVICPWLMQNPDIQESVVAEPVLSSDRTSISSVEGDTTTMSCSIQSSIKYCYFRAQNGTVFTVTPATSTAAMEYVGNGFDAGECGVRFKNLQHNDSGRWSCHVGLVDGIEEEQSSRFQVIIQEALMVEHFKSKMGLFLKAWVYGNRQLEYCRFVRIDGFGFMTGRIPSGYKDKSMLEYGSCYLQIEEPTVLNLHPWTVIVKIRGQDVELSRQSTDNLLVFESESGSWSMSIHVWITIIVIGLAFILLGLSLGPKSNREWTYARASLLRNSIRNSMRKTKPHETV